MKKIIRIQSALLAGILLSAAVPGETALRAEETAKQIDILFTHDTHSHLNSFSTVLDGKDTVTGGFARIKTLINGWKEKNPDTLVLDAGDFSMGTLVQTIFGEEAAELRMLGEIGCDVTTLGNHEFDYRSEGLASMLESAASKGSALPELVVCNVDWEAMEKAGLSEGQKEIADAFDTYDVKDYVILEKGDVNVAVLGVFGDDALACAPTCELLFEDPVKAVKETVEEIRSDTDVDLIVCVSHSGTWEDESKSEDEILAKSVPELDLIVSGHTHTELTEPVIHGNTAIVSAGEYGKHLGSLSMQQDEGGRWSVADYELLPVTEEIAADTQTQEKIDAFMETVDAGYLSAFGYTREQVLAINEVDFCSLKDLEMIHTELNLGDIISDAYLYAAGAAGALNKDIPSLAVVPGGTIRDTYTRGAVTVESVFNSFSLGTGPDGVPGYPLICVWLTGEELRTAAEIDASVSDYMTTARLFISGMNFSYNPHRLILDRVTDLYLTGEDGGRMEVENDKLYQVVADLYSGQMLGAVTGMSYGLLSVVPRYEDGTPIEDFEDVIITENGKELKAWDAIARYMTSFPDTDGDGIPEIPVYYSTLHGRKVVEEGRSLSDLLRNPGRYAVMMAIAAAAFLLAAVLLVFLLTKAIRRRGRGIRRSRRGV